MPQPCVLLLSDPLASLNPASDSSLPLMYEALKRGLKPFHCTPADLYLDNGVAYAWVAPMDQKDGRWHSSQPERQDLGHFSVIFMRQDPPFNIGYISATYILDCVASTTLVVNHPTAVRRWPEKIFPAHFADLMPATWIGQSLLGMIDFLDQHSQAVLKPLYGRGGCDVLHLTPDIYASKERLDTLINLYRAKYPGEPLILQEYLADVVRDGDKRIILVDGQIAGAIRRRPAQGHIRANLAVGGQAEKTSLSDQDRQLCATLGPVLREHGLILVGIDVIDGRLIEINITSPTGIQEINRFNNSCIQAMVFDAIEKRLLKADHTL